MGREKLENNRVFLLFLHCLMEKGIRVNLLYLAIGMSNTDKTNESQKIMNMLYKLRYEGIN